MIGPIVVAALAVGFIVLMSNHETTPLQNTAPRAAPGPAAQMANRPPPAQPAPAPPAQQQSPNATLQTIGQAVTIANGALGLLDKIGEYTDSSADDTEYPIAAQPAQTFARTMEPQLSVFAPNFSSVDYTEEDGIFNSSYL